MKKKLVMFYAALMVLALGFSAAPAAWAVDYIDENGDTKTYDGTPTPYTGQTALATGWYLVEGTKTPISNARITVTGDVHIILANDSHLDASSRGIGVSQGNSLTIYAQSTEDGEMGELTATAGSMDPNAGIGGGRNTGVGTITINGGTVTATGGSTIAGAGIGGGDGGGDGGAGGTVIINGGAVKATGGNSSAGIGGGRNGSGGEITINGGTVIANGDSEGGAGIGGGNVGGGGEITITGGTVTANGGGFGGAGIGGGLDGSGGGEITITGGTVETEGGNNGGAGIGGGRNGNSGEITITVPVAAAGGQGNQYYGKGPAIGEGGKSGGTPGGEYYEEGYYTIHSSVEGGNGNVSPLGNSLMGIVGRDMRFTVTPNAGYAAFVSVDGGEPGEVTGSEYAFSGVEGQTYTIKASFEQISVTGVTLDKPTLTLELGETETLIVTIQPTNAVNKNVTWASNNEEVATVLNGVVTAVSAGTATITVTTEDGEFEATCMVTVNALVNAKAPTITRQPESAEVTAGTVHPLTVEASVETGGVLSYQWHSNTQESNTGGTPVGTGATTYSPPTSTIGKMYYYVIVKNTNNSVNGEKTASVTSEVVTITVEAFSFTTTALPGGTVGTVYNQSITTTGTTPTEWTHTGNLPDGLTLSNNGVISGMPSASGKFTFTVIGTNSAGSNTKEFSIEIASSDNDPSTSDSGGGCDTGAGVAGILGMAAALLALRKQRT